MANRFNSDQSVFATPAADLHLTRRGALNPLFSRARILSLETVVRDKVNLLMKRIRTFQISGKPFSLSAGFMALAGDVIMQYCFSLNYDHLNSEDFKTTFHEPFMAVSISGHLSLQFPIVPKILFAMPESWLAKTEPLFALMFQLQKDFRKQIVALKEGKNEGVTKSALPTVFQELLNNQNLPPDQKATDRLQDEAQLVVAAGITTVGWALSIGAFHIINQPSVFSRLRQELQEAIPDPSTPLNWTELERLPYLTGCIREAIRLSYPVTSRNPRLLSKPLVYEDWVIPPRTPVSMTIIDINNDEDIFPEHNRFKPERWINPPPTKDGSNLERYFVCFQKGSRSCLGIK
jgi:cytochrome P450